MKRRLILVTASTPWAEIKCFYYYVPSNSSATNFPPEENFEELKLQNCSYFAPSILRNMLWKNTNMTGAIDHCPTTEKLRDLGIRLAKENSWLNRLGDTSTFTFKTFVSQTEQHELLIKELYGRFRSTEIQVKNVLRQKRVKEISQQLTPKLSQACAAK